MIPLEQAAEYFRKTATSAVGNSQKRASLIASLDGTALIKSRIQLKGEKADGSDFSKYSTAEVPTFFFAGRSRTGSEAAYERLKKKKGSFASYQDWREANNLQTKHKDFTFSGRMMTNIKPVVLESSITKTIVEINAINADERQKVKWLTEQQGNFLIPSKKELQFMSDTYNDEFSKELIKSLQ